MTSFNEIRVIWPTIRPDKAILGAIAWACARSQPDKIFVRFLFAAHDQAGADLINNTSANFTGKTKDNCTYRADYFDRARPGVTAAVCCLTHREVEHDDSQEAIYVVASDDFAAPAGWDAHLIDQYKDFNGALIVNDGYKLGTNIIPLPVMSGAFMRRINGQVYHADYHHFFSDQELFDVVQEIGDVKDLRGTDAPAFRHLHWSFGGRDQDIHDMRNSGWWKEDSATYDRRKVMTLTEKLR